MNELDIKYNEIEDLDYCIELLNKRDKEIENLKQQLDKLGLLNKEIEKETKVVNITCTMPKWLKELARKNKINFSKLLQESLYEVLDIGSDKE